MKIAENKKAWHDYFIETKIEAGIVLRGFEIKSIRSGKVSIKEAHIRIKNDEAFVINMNIKQFEKTTNITYNPTKSRKLLLNKKEIRKLAKEVDQKNYTILPLKLYLKNGKAKLLIATGKGKKKYDKREVEKKRSMQKEIQKTIKEKNS